MKKTLLIFSMLSGILFSGNLFAGGGPDKFGYTWLDSNDPGGPTYNWIDITTKPGATQVKLLSDDNTRGPFNMPFKFHYYWYDVDKFWVGSNGYIIFNNGAMAAPFPAIPSSAAPNDFVAVMESDLSFIGAGNTAECYYWFNNAQDSLVISYLNVPFWQDSTTDPPYPYVGSNTFQVIFSGVDSSITFQYMDQQGTYTNPSQFMTIGIENVSGTIGLQHSYDTYPANFYAIKYFHPPDTLQTKDASAVWAGNPETAGIFLPRKGAPRALQAMIQNTGNTKLNPFNVNGKVINGSGVVQGLISNNTSDTMLAAQTKIINFTNKFNPVNAGIFRFVTSTQLSGDAVPTNNVATQEVRVVDTTLASTLLSFCDNSSEGLGGLSWSGGSGGGGIYFIPPYYPCNVTDIQFYIVGNPLQSTFYGKIFDDNGNNGEPGTMIDSVAPVSPPVDDAGHWEILPLNNPFYCTSGGFYVSWNMNGNQIALGQDQTLPISNRSFEVLGNTWAIYRSRETEDLMINATIQASHVGIKGVENGKNIGEFYPNPSNDNVSLNYSLSKSESVSARVYDIQGRTIFTEQLGTRASGTHRMDINVSKLNAGIYFCELTTDGKVSTRKFSVVK